MADEKVIGKAFTYLIVNSLIGTLIFMMVQVLYGDNIRDIASSVTDESLTILIFIVNGGLYIGVISSIIVAVIGSEKMKSNQILLVVAFTYVVSILILINVSYDSMTISNPEIFTNLTFIEKVVNVPRIITYFAIYKLSTPILIWYIYLYMYNIIFFISMFIFKVRIV